MLKIRSNASLFLCVIIAICLFQSYGYSEDRFVKTIPNWKWKHSPLIDTETNLTWCPKLIEVQNLKGKEGVIKDISTYVEKFSYTKRKITGWRVPTVVELRSISTSWLPWALKKKYGCTESPLFTNQINDLLVNLYIPESDSEIIVSRDNSKIRPLIRLVKGTVKKNYQFKSQKSYLSEFDEKIQNLIQIDGALFFLWLEWCPIPIDNLEYPHLTFCPIQANIFGSLETSYVQNLPLEVLASNHIPSNSKFGSVLFSRIKGFYEESLLIKKMTKFEIFDKKEELTNKLANIHQKYRQEYLKYTNSIFMVTPEQSQMDITLANYNFDDQTLTVQLGSKYLYESWGTKFQNIPNEAYKLPLSVNDAKFLFSKSDKVSTKLFTFVQPIKNNIENSKYFRYQIKSKVVIIYSSNGEKLFSFVFHKFKNKGRKWELNMIKY